MSTFAPSTNDFSSFLNKYLLKLEKPNIDEITSFVQNFKDLVQNNQNCFIIPKIIYDHPVLRYITNLICSEFNFEHHKPPKKYTPKNEKAWTNIKSNESKYQIEFQKEILNNLSQSYHCFTKTIYDKQFNVWLYVLACKIYEIYENNNVGTIQFDQKETFDLPKKINISQSKYTKFISIDLKHAAFLTMLLNYPQLFNNQSSWGSFLKTLDLGNIDEENLVVLTKKKYRNSFISLLNRDYQIHQMKLIMQKFYSVLKNLNITDVFTVSEDEIVIPIAENTNCSELVTKISTELSKICSTYKTNFTDIIFVKIHCFDLIPFKLINQTKNIKFYVKQFITFDIKQQYVEFSSDKFALYSLDKDLYDIANEQLQLYYDNGKHDTSILQNH